MGFSSVGQSVFKAFAQIILLLLHTLHTLDYSINIMFLQVTLFFAFSNFTEFPQRAGILFANGELCFQTIKQRDLFLILNVLIDTAGNV